MFSPSPLSSPSHRVQRLTAQITSAKTAHLETRLLLESDFDRGFLQLLGQLTDVGSPDRRTFQARYREMMRCADTYHTVVIIDKSADKVIACATLFVELKFVHGCSKVGHVEDVVVDKTYRGLSLGARVVNKLRDIAKEKGCYKIILDCSDDNVPFYERVGYKRKENQMVIYFDR